LKKKHLVLFYNQDSKNNLCNAPKITYSHIVPGPFEKMCVYLPAQVFSEYRSWDASFLSIKPLT
jgi:hypothetical protein